MPDTRTPTYPIAEDYLSRWSPRAFSDEEVSEAALLTMIEAARWAPSCYNSQPWRFIYVRKGEPVWEASLDTLVPFNRMWGEKAGAVVFLVSAVKMITKPGEAPAPADYHTFDSGAAWAYFALQASRMGLASHGVAGFDKDKVRQLFSIPQDFTCEIAILAGKPGDKSGLPEFLQGKEEPSQRRPLAEIAFNGYFQGSL
ncbi:nitroreductase family protein [Verticiella sediminum]|uniref:Nitroreductase family protein n=1 Tax=Verticiella sediminum TaxID=1247510 RepID=A0A556AQ01_9BURK|nr:nitroreductase family protein [Verticiella sediminum]TSH94979.1 nitroreductase family protein [Verticiella sediminum]